jgi:hypothetical protein
MTQFIIYYVDRKRIYDKIENNSVGGYVEIQSISLSILFWHWKLGRYWCQAE